jgi:hypothetical protein
LLLYQFIALPEINYQKGSSVKREKKKKEKKKKKESQLAGVAHDLSRFF